MKTATQNHTFQKSPTGIAGFDEITFGGLPNRRTTLICGGPGCGKTLFAMEFLIKGITDFNEPGVFIAFEENSSELIENYSSINENINDLLVNNKLLFDYIQVEKNDFESGEYDLSALFIRIDHALSHVKAKRLVIDTIETLFEGFSETVIRAELRKLFRWLKDKGVTTIVTGEKGEGALTRHGIEEYVSDCVIFLDHRVENQLSTRRLRVVKYRGSHHGTNEYPFLIDANGVSVLPITSVGLDYSVSKERISTGVGELDNMFEKKGFYRGSTILVSGTAGTGKTTIASQFVNAACQRKEKCLYFAFEESANQIVRNMTSVGINFNNPLKEGLLKFHTVRPTLYGLELHLVTLHKLIVEYEPDIVVLDPISNLISQGNSDEVKSMLLRMIDFMKLKHITTMMTNLTSRNADFDHIEINVSSIADTWITLRDIEKNGELTRGLYVVKSRGMSHSNKVREFLITQNGFALGNL